MNENKLAQKSAIRTLQRFIGGTVKNHKGIMFLGILSSIAYPLCNVFLNPLIVAKIVDIVSTRNVTSKEVLPVFGPYILMLILTNLVCQIVSKTQDYAVWKLQILGSYDLSKMVFSRISSQSMTFHNSRFGGALVSATAKFTGAYSILAQIFLYNIVPIVSTTIFIVAFLAPKVPLYIICLLIILVIYVTVVFTMFRRILKFNSKNAGAQNELSGVLSDAITNILAVKTCSREQYEKELFEEVNEKVYATGSKGMRVSLFSASVAAGIIVVIMTLLTIFIAGGNPWFGISPGTLIMMFTYTSSLCGNYNYISVMMQNINRALGDAQEMTIILDEPTLVEDAKDATELTVSKGDIDIDHLNFSYIDNSLPQEVFSDFSLHIPAGQSVGLVGKSGSGKTTLTRLLLRLADIKEGSIKIDGQDISKITQESLRKNIAYVPQEPLLFHRTIAENIAYGKPDASMEEIREAARKANATDFIEKLPLGYDTVTGERGVKLSGGQRQRIAIARAILQDCPILVLDEATSALDSESEQAIQEALKTLMKNRTSIVVAHRLSTVARLDRIILLKDGVITEDGTHKELSEGGGEYADLWNRQTGAFFEN